MFHVRHVSTRVSNGRWLVKVPETKLTFARVKLYC